MAEQYDKAVLETVELTRLSSVVTYSEEVDRILSLSGRELTNLTDSKLSQYLFTLTNHITYVQLHYNIRNMWHLRAKGKYELELNKALAEMASSKLTVKEKTAKAMENPKLTELYEDWKSKEAQYTMLHKIPESLLEVANSIKKEMTIRSLKRS
jgi:hypothetical protein